MTSYIRLRRITAGLTIYMRCVSHRPVTYLRLLQKSYGSVQNVTSRSCPGKRHHLDPREPTYGPLLQSRTAYAYSRQTRCLPAILRKWNLDAVALGLPVHADSTGGDTTLTGVLGQI